MNSVALFVTEYYLLLKTLCIDGTGIFCCCAGIKKRIIGSGSVVGLFVRFVHLRNLRFDKYGHHKELAPKGCDDCILWGVFLCSMVASISFLIGKWLS
jgi:hypothetical protein